MSWGGFLRWFLLVFAGTLVSAFAFIALMNPFGNLTPRAFAAHVIMDTNDRYQYPSIVRSGRRGVLTRRPAHPGDRRC